MVLIALVALEHGAVGHLVQQVVAKGELARIGKGAVFAGQRQRPLTQRAQFGGGVVVQRRQRIVPEHGSDHAGLLQRPALRRQQRVEPGLQHTHQRGRHLQVRQAARRQLPVHGGRDQHALVDQHLQQRFHAARVAVGAFDKQLPQRRPVHMRPEVLQQRSRQRLAVVGRQGLQQQTAVHGPGLGQANAPFEQLGSRGTNGQQRQVVAGAGQVHDGIQRSVTGPVQVVEHQHQHGLRRHLRAPHAQEQSLSMESACAQLFAVLHDAGDERAGTAIQPNQLAEQSGWLRACSPNQGARPSASLACASVKESLSCTSKRRKSRSRMTP